MKYSLQERKSIARQVANTVWQGQTNNHRLGVARRCVESVIENGITNRQAIWTEATKRLRAGWTPL